MVVPLFTGTAEKNDAKFFGALRIGDNRPSVKLLNLRFCTMVAQVCLALSGRSTTADCQLLNVVLQVLPEKVEDRLSILARVTTG